MSSDVPDVPMHLRCATTTISLIGVSKPTGTGRFNRSGTFPNVPNAPNSPKTSEASWNAESVDDMTHQGDQGERLPCDLQIASLRSNISLGNRINESRPHVENTEAPSRS
jgi:hypothetical protein